MQAHIPDPPEPDEAGAGEYVVLGALEELWVYVEPVLLET
jgi:hypothetical protein